MEAGWPTLAQRSTAWKTPTKTYTSFLLKLRKSLQKVGQKFTNVRWEWMKSFYNIVLKNIIKSFWKMLK